MKSTSVCPACGYSDKYNKFRSLISNYRIIECINCGSNYAITDSSYHEHMHRDSISQKKAHYYGQQYNTSEALINLLKYYPSPDQVISFYRDKHKYGPAIKLLNMHDHNIVYEIGSGSGHFVAALRYLGYKAYGFEISRSAIDYSNNTHGNFYHHIDELNHIDSSSPDVLFLLGTIGCVQNPRVILNEAISLLNKKPSSFIFFNAPNVEYVQRTPFNWTDSPPPDVITLFRQDYWQRFYSYQNVSVSVKLLYSEPLTILKSALRNLLDCRLKLVFLNSITFFLSIIYKIPHQYGQLVVLRQR